MQTRFGLFGAARKLRGGVYVISVLGLTAIFGAIAFGRGKDPWLFSAIAFVLGVLFFRNQLRPLSWPRLLLTKESLLLLRRRSAALAIPWDAIARIEPKGHTVLLTFHRELEIPGEGAVEGLGLDAKKLRTTPQALTETLQQARSNPNPLPNQDEASKLA